MSNQDDYSNLEDLIEHAKGELNHENTSLLRLSQQDLVVIGRALAVYRALTFPPLHITSAVATERLRNLAPQIGANTELPPRTDEANTELPLRIDVSRAYWRNAPLALSLTQFWILRDLFEHAGQVRSVTDLMRAANISVQPNTIVVRINAIRDEFMKIDPGFACIRSERGRGYCWLEFNVASRRT